jgi:hypothetical protein
MAYLGKRYERLQDTNIIEKKLFESSINTLFTSGVTGLVWPHFGYRSFDNELNDWLRNTRDALAAVDATLLTIPVSIFRLSL